MPNNWHTKERLQKLHLLMSLTKEPQHTSPLSRVKVYKDEVYTYLMCKRKTKDSIPLHLAKIQEDSAQE